MVVGSRAAYTPHHNMGQIPRRPYPTAFRFRAALSSVSMIVGARNQRYFKMADSVIPTTLNRSGPKDEGSRFGFLEI